MRKVKKAVILAAGLGTRVLPATKAVPKEMLNIADKPAIQYLVEEAADSGAEDVMIVVSRGKTAIQDHFDRAPELELALINGEKKELYEQVVRVTELANITYCRQREMKGIGHAVLCAESFVGGEPFAVICGDDIIIGDEPATAQVIRAYEEYGLGSVAMKEMPEELVAKYSSLGVRNLRDNIYAVSDMIEKPKKGEFLSNFSMSGRCVLPPEIFALIRESGAGAGGEIHLADAIGMLARTRGMTGVELTGTWYDMGDKLGILKATVEIGLRHGQVGDRFRDYLRGLAL